MIKSSFLKNGCNLEGVTHNFLEESHDKRGSFIELFVESWNISFKPVQWSVVNSKENCFRGMHYHNDHDEYFSLISGHCLVGLKDLRPHSTTYNKTALYELHDTSKSFIQFPKGLLHGWYFLQDSTHIQAVSESYSDYHARDNHGCRWNDKDLGIPWPFNNPIISEKAKNFQSEKELRVFLKL